MRIVMANIIYPTPEHPTIVGGAEVSTRNLSEALVQKGHEVLVLCSHDRGDHLFDEVVNGVRVVSRPIRNYYWPWDGRKRGNLKKGLFQFIDNMPRPPIGFEDVVADFKPDIAYTSNLIGLTWGIWEFLHRQNVPIIHIIRDYYLSCGRSARFRGGHRCIRTCLDCRLATYRRGPRTDLVTAVVGNSKVTLDIHLRENLFRNAAFKLAIPNIAPPEPVAGPWQATGKPLRFGYIGRLSPEKGVGDLAAAYGRLPLPASLVVAGEADAETREALLVAANGRPIEFLGFVKPELFYRNVDVVIIPSTWDEPLPRAVLQAQAFGLPVIGADRGGIAESVGDVGAGWLYDPDDPDALERAMASVAKDPAAVEAAAAAALEARYRFAPETVLGKHLALIDDVLAHTKHRQS